MSGTSPTSVVTMADAGGGGGGYYYRPPPFTAAQWQELELQAMIYKYLMAGIPIPSELIVAVRRSFDAISSRFFDSSLSYCSSYYGKKFDPEPGRCKRTDGKKWRCAKDAHPDSKYCERHMHRGKGRSNPRSRKPVESSSSYSASHQQHQKTTSLSFAAAGATQNTAASAAGYSSSSRNGIFQGSSGINGVYQNIPFFSIGSSDDVYSGKNVAKFRIDYGSSENDNRGYKYVNGARDPGDLSLEASGSIGNHVMGCSNAAAAGQSSEFHQIVNGYDHMEESTMSKLKQQNFYGEIEPVKHEHHSMQPFFDEWPTTKESWSNDLGENGAWKNNTTHSKTMLSMSTTPMMDYSEFSASNAHSPNGESDKG